MKPRYDRFECGSLTMNGSGVPVAEEPDDATTFCALLPKLPPWKFSASSPGFLGSRSPAQSSVQTPPGLATALGSCESLCPAPCSLQPPTRSRIAGDSSVRLQGVSLAGEQSNRRGGFINKPPQGWLHPETQILQSGVLYLVRYMGCIEVVKSMRSLDFSTRTQVTREAINRLHEAVPGVKGVWKKKPPNQALHSVLGRSNLRFAGMSVTLNISIEGLNLALPTSRQIIANHNMQSISFASGGDADTADYVAYVAKDPVNQRACHILECCEGLAQTVISTIGQAIELRFKQYLHTSPKLVAPHDRMTSSEESSWGEEEVTPDHNYYNSIPGKQPPLGGIVDVRGRQWQVQTQPPCSMGIQQVSASLQRANSHMSQNMDSLNEDAKLFVAGVSSDGYLWPFRKDLCEEHMYVNTQTLDAHQWMNGISGDTAISPEKDAFDMRPFEDALKLHDANSGKGNGQGTGSLLPNPGLGRDTEEEQLKRESWYHGKISRKVAEALLMQDGDFLVRDSLTNPGQYVLTGMHNGQAKHLLLVDPEGVVRTKDLLFESINHLINYHFESKVPIVAAESEVCLKQVIKRTHSRPLTCVRSIVLRRQPLSSRTLTIPSSLLLSGGSRA
ncbi:LOW QUALITY PROTEIN: SHC-transforming protein 2-like [Narcine bancroftii]|uniref:LOW QUALITY PROTEIN: SHC-transforming protein 2-like n=1 Tax=Narcine bancroftii TaxID=1343680 RepID=UPI00383177D2